MVKRQKYVALWPGPKVAVTRRDQSPAFVGAVTPTRPLPEAPSDGLPAIPLDTSAQADVQLAGVAPPRDASSSAPGAAVPSTLPVIHGASDPAEPHVYEPSWPVAAAPSSPRSTATGGLAGIGPGVADGVGDTLGLTGARVDAAAVTAAALGIAPDVRAGLAAAGTLAAAGFPTLWGGEEAPPVHPAASRTAATTAPTRPPNPNRAPMGTTPFMAVLPRPPRAGTGSGCT